MAAANTLLREVLPKVRDLRDIALRELLTLYIPPVFHIYMEKFRKLTSRRKKTPSEPATPEAALTR